MRSKKIKNNHRDKKVVKNAPEQIILYSHNVHIYSKQTNNHPIMVHITKHMFTKDDNYILK